MPSVAMNDVDPDADDQPPMTTPISAPAPSVSTIATGTDACFMRQQPRDEHRAEADLGADREVEHAGGERDAEPDRDDAR